MSKKESLDRLLARKENELKVLHSDLAFTKTPLAFFLFFGLPAVFSFLILREYLPLFLSYYKDSISIVTFFAIIIPSGLYLLNIQKKLNNRYIQCITNIEEIKRIKNGNN